MTVDPVIAIASSESQLSGLPWWLCSKESDCQCMDMGLIPHPGRSHMPTKPCATTTEPAFQNPGAATTESHEPRACAPQQAIGMSNLHIATRE